MPTKRQFGGADRGGGQEINYHLSNGAASPAFKNQDLLTKVQLQTVHEMLSRNVSFEERLSFYFGYQHKCHIIKYKRPALDLLRF